MMIFDIPRYMTQVSELPSFVVAMNSSAIGRRIPLYGGDVICSRYSKQVPVYPDFKDLNFVPGARVNVQLSTQYNNVE